MWQYSFMLLEYCHILFLLCKRLITKGEWTLYFERMVSYQLDNEA